MYTFKKQEKICSKKIIDELYLKGQSFISYPFRISYLKYELNTSYPSQVLFIASKKRFKKAHDRNRIKRLLREAYRFTKVDFYNKLNDKQIKVVISINYVGKEDHSLEQLKIQLNKAFEKIISGF